MNLGLDAVIAKDEMGQVSLVGAVCPRSYSASPRGVPDPGREGINIEMISTSPIKISCVIRGDRVTDAVRALHLAFDLGAEDVRTEDPFGVRS